MICPSCQKFRKSKLCYRIPGVVSSVCGDCRRKWRCSTDPAYDKAFKERRLKESRKHRKEHPKENRQNRLKREYGLTPESFEKMVNSQNKQCAICRLSPTNRGLVVDHDHATNQIRALLCNRCNIMLGVAHDDPEVLTRAIEYLHKFSSGPKKH
jgi:hypothetical protein